MRRLQLHLLLIGLLMMPIAGCHYEPAPVGPIADDAPTGKLSIGVRPQAYRLNLTIDPRRDEFFGNVAIDIQLDEPARHIWIHGRNLNIETVLAVLPDGSDIAAEYEEVLATGVARVTFEEEVPSGILTLQMQYGAAFDRNLHVLVGFPQ